MRTHSSNLCTARRNSLDSDTSLGRIPRQRTSQTLRLRKRRELLLRSTRLHYFFFSHGSHSSRIYTQKTCPTVFTWNRFLWTLTVFLASFGLANTVPSADGMTWAFASLFADVTPRWNQVPQVVKVYGVGWAAEIVKLSHNLFILQTYLLTGHTKVAVLDVEREKKCYM